MGLNYKPMRDPKLRDDDESSPDEDMTILSNIGGMKKAPSMRRRSTLGMSDAKGLPIFLPRKDYSSGSNKLADVMKSYLLNDESTLTHSIVRHLEFDLARSRFNINTHSCYQAAAFSVRDRLIEMWNDSQIEITKSNPKRIYYLSIEYLMGRSFQNALINLEIEAPMKGALKNLGMNMEEVVEQENDAGLGNGGLGRLAACYLDSMATLNLPAWGYGLRYTFGIFKQSIVNGHQYEIPDYWLGDRNPWEIERSDLVYKVCFGGHVVKEYPGGVETSIWVPSEVVQAKAYDNPIPGFSTRNTINLRLWKSIPSEQFDFQKFNTGDYYGTVKTNQDAELITSVLYPNDSTPMGRELRLKQEYFFVCATIQDILRRFFKNNQNLLDLPGKVAIQLNDTHPALAIVELLRILVDEHKFEMMIAWHLITKVFSYTNHTVLPEALEKWNIEVFQKLLPRHLELIYTVNFFFMESIKNEFPGNQAKLSALSLIEESNPKKVRMANLCVLGSHKVNGVSAIHSEIIKNQTFRDFYDLDQKKFINVTNGVTVRRWIAEANPPLAELYNEALATNDYLVDFEIIKSLNQKATDANFAKKWKAVKQKAKARLSKFVKNNFKVDLPESFLFDVLVKRIHEYKRQLLFILFIMHRYLHLKKANKNERQDAVPRAFILAGKAAPGYYIAKKIIKLAYAVSDLVNGDAELNQYIRFVFLPNYSVSMAELIVPAADVTEQISLAGTEASGTSNMKFALNGGLIVGTMDGANIEIAQEVGEENLFIFGSRFEQVEPAKNRMRNSNYEEYFPAELQEVIHEIRSGLIGDPNEFHEVLNSFTNKNDWYLLGTDWTDYLRAQADVDKTWRNQREWLKKSILTAVNSSKFSSDRSVAEYAENIWGVSPINEFAN